MELTDEQRAELGQIALASYARDGSEPAGRGRAAIEARKRTRAKLRQLRDAWEALDGETQQDVIAHLLRMWEEYDPTEPAEDGMTLARPLPDVGVVAGELEAALTAPQGRGEDHPGLTDATKYLWRVWVTERPGVVPIDRAALSAIGNELATTFRLPPADAARRADDILRAGTRAGATFASATCPGGGAPTCPQRVKGLLPAPLP